MAGELLGVRRGRAGRGLVQPPLRDRLGDVRERLAALVVELEGDVGLVGVGVLLLLGVADLVAREGGPVLEHVPAAARVVVALVLGRVGVVRRRLLLDHDRALGHREDLAARRLLLVGLVDEEVALGGPGPGDQLLGLGVEQVEGRPGGRAGVLEALGLSLGGELDRVVEPVERELGGAVRLRGRVGNYVRLPVVEEELRRVADLGDRALGVLDVGEPDADGVRAQARDLGLGDAQGVGPLADDLDRAVHVLALDLGVLGRRAALVDELGAAAQVQAELRVLGIDHGQGRQRQAQDEGEDEEVAAAAAHAGGSYSGVRTSSSPPSSS